MINVTSTDSLAVDITNGKHKIVGDVAQANGGNDTGLNPHELLEASLASCTNITVMMYAKMKTIPLKRMETKVTIIKEGDENLISREVKFHGELDPSQKERLLKIANKCPMHNFISKKSIIQTREV